jgi:hypothetical protein
MNINIKLLSKQEKENLFVLLFNDLDKDEIFDLYKAEYESMEDMLDMLREDLGV